MQFFHQPQRHRRVGVAAAEHVSLIVTLDSHQIDAGIHIAVHVHHRRIAERRAAAQHAVVAWLDLGPERAEGEQPFQRPVAGCLDIKQRVQQTVDIGNQFIRQQILVGVHHVDRHERRAIAAEGKVVTGGFGHLVLVERRYGRAQTDRDACLGQRFHVGGDRSMRTGAALVRTAGVMHVAHPVDIAEHRDAMRLYAGDEVFRQKTEIAGDVVAELDVRVPGF